MAWKEFGPIFDTRDCSRLEILEKLLIVYDDHSGENPEPEISRIRSNIEAINDISVPDVYEALENSVWMESATDEVCDYIRELCPPFIGFRLYEERYEFFFNRESYNQAVIDREVIQVDAGREYTSDDLMKISKDYQYIAEVSDHGNITLKDMSEEILWEIV